jgi:hypothetical protein
MILKRLQTFLVSKAPFLYLVSEEEERVERLIASVAEKGTNRAYQVYIWSCIQGLFKLNGPVVDETADAVTGLARFLKEKDAAVLIFRDFHLFSENPTLLRQIRDAARHLRTSRNKVFFICPRLVLPDELFPLFQIDDVPLPQQDEISRVLDAAINEHVNKESLRQSLNPDLREKLTRAAQGFTAHQALETFATALTGSSAITGKTVDLVLERKEGLVRRSGVLEFVPASAETWEIGGLLNLKKWLKERGGAFSAEAARAGLVPKGILVMGVSGCGKSLCIKAIAAYWKLPLLRLDMGRVYDGLAGLPEEAMRKAIKTAEAVAPCVLWIDEIEAGIANQQQKQGGGREARVLALFLTWMQEKTAPVFVGATANEVEVLPPEILRKGRFDELFYMGLPSNDEREQILTIHMKKRKVDPGKFDMNYLAQSTEGLNGAEIEQGVISAIFEASSEKTEVTEHILANCLRNIVPLSRTMRERIQKIEAWARDRAMKASLQTL